MMDLDQSQLMATPDKFTTLRMTYSNPGDVLYIPAGSLLVEKALGAHCMALRVPLTLVSPACRMTNSLFVKAKSQSKDPNIGCTRGTFFCHVKPPVIVINHWLLYIDHWPRSSHHIHHIDIRFLLFTYFLHLLTSRGSLLRKPLDG